MAIVSVPAGTPTQIASGTASVAINTSTGAVTITPTAGQNAVLANGQFLVPDGTASAPALAFSSEAGFGWYRPGATAIATGTSGGSSIYISNVITQLLNSAAFGWGSGNANGTADLSLFRDAADTLAQRRGTNAQIARWYETWTNSTNYSRLSASAAAGGPFVLTPQALGTGTLRGLQIGATGVSFGAMGATPVAQQASGANLTNSVTAGGTDDTIANYTDLVIYANDSAAIRNDIYQLARKLKQVNDALRLYGLLT